MVSTKVTIGKGKNKIEAEIIKFNASKAFILGLETTGLLAPAIKDIATAVQGNLSDTEQLGILSGALQDLFNRKTPEQIFEYAEKMLTSGYLIIGKNKILDIDDLDAVANDDHDSLSLLLTLLTESIKYNFGSALGKLMSAKEKTPG